MRTRTRWTSERTPGPGPRWATPQRRRRGDVVSGLQQALVHLGKHVDTLWTEREDVAQGELPVEEVMVCRSWT